MIPVTIISGFLGSGKTTLINQLIAAYPSERFAIITNEFGQSDLESKFYKHPKEQIIEFPSGCLCHAPKGNISKAIQKLLVFQPDTTHILVEPSGLSDPYAVAAALENIDCIICTLDCTNYPNPNFKKEQERQLDCADIVVLTKTDLCRDGIYPVSTLAIKAKIVPKTRQNLKLLLNTKITLPRHPKRPRSGGGVEGSVPHSSHQSFIYKATTSFDQLKLESFLKNLPNSIIRVKGVVNLDNQNKKSFLLNYVGQRHSLEQTNYDIDSVILFIGTSFDKTKLKHGLQKCLYKNDLNIAQKLLHRLIIKINW